MNNRGQLKATLGIGVVLIVAIIFFILIAFTDPIKEQLDNIRGNSSVSSLNCPGTPGFNQTDYDDDTTGERLLKRPTCFATGMYLVYFACAVLIAAFVWAWGKFKK